MAPASSSVAQALPSAGKRVTASSWPSAAFAVSRSSMPAQGLRRGETHIVMTRGRRPHPRDPSPPPLRARRGPAPRRSRPRSRGPRRRGGLLQVSTPPCPSAASASRPNRDLGHRARGQLREVAHRDRMHRADMVRHRAPLRHRYPRVARPELLEPRADAPEVRRLPADDPREDRLAERHRLQAPPHRERGAHARACPSRCPARTGPRASRGAPPWSSATTPCRAPGSRRSAPRDGARIGAEDTPASQRVRVGHDLSRSTHRLVSAGSTSRVRDGSGPRFRSPAFCACPWST